MIGNTASEWSETEWTAFREWVSGALRTNATPVTVTFTKKDGTERVMKCTLNPDMLPPQVITEDKPERKTPEHSMAVFDMEIKEWRSFVIKNVKRVEFEL